MNCCLKSSLLSLLVALGVSITPSVGFADWSDNFDGGLQAAWQFGSVNGLGVPSPTFSATSTNNQLLMTDSVPAAPTGAGAAAGFGVVLDPLGDQVVAGTINPNGDAGISPTMTLLARGNPALGSLYAAEVDYSSNDLIIFRNDNLASTTDLVSAPIPGLTTDQSLYVEFRLLGSSLSARAFDAPGGTLLQSVSVIDSTFSTGLSGVLVNADDPSVTVLGVWDNVSATTIPEPASCVMLLLAVSLGLSHTRRNRLQ